MGIVYSIIMFAFIVIMSATVIATMFVQGLSDEDREKWGHGPKGQGR